MSIAAFLHEIEDKLKTGQATEHTYRAALEALFNTLLTPARATNEPKQASYGAPDFIIQQGNAPIGHAEAKDVGLNLDKFIADSEREVPRTREGEQLKRYRAALPNLLYTDGLEWHWFVNGEPGGRGEEASVSLPIRIDADDAEVYRVVAAAEELLARLCVARTVREMEREEELQAWRARAAPMPPPDEELEWGSFYAKLLPRSPFGVNSTAYKGRYVRLVTSTL